MEIWKPSNEKKRKINDGITVLKGKSTPHLDADLFFNNKGEFCTRMYFKERYKIRTAELTSRTPENESSGLSALYIQT